MEAGNALQSRSKAGRGQPRNPLHNPLHNPPLTGLGRRRACCGNEKFPLARPMLPLAGEIQSG
jgi:hypothetical protein